MTLQTGLHRLDVQAERIRMARAGAKLSLRAFAEAVSQHMVKPISHETIRQLEKGERDAKMGELIAISVVTSKRVEWLAGGSGVPSDSELHVAPVAQLALAQLNQPIPMALQPVDLAA